MSHQVRDKTIELISSIKNSKLNELEIKDIEIGIFNWTIDFCIKNNIIKNWDNNKFKKIYINKSISVISNLDPKQYLKNKYLLKLLQNKKINPHEIPYMKNEDIYPDKWNNIKNILEKKVEGLKHNKNIYLLLTNLDAENAKKENALTMNYKLEVLMKVLHYLLLVLIVMQNGNNKIY